MNALIEYRNALSRLFKMSQTQHLSLLVIGNTGVGKSSLCNHLTQSTHFKTSGADVAETKDCDKLYSSYLKVQVVDTPGFKDTTGKPNLRLQESILKYCMNQNLALSLIMIVILGLTSFTRRDTDIEAMIKMISELAPEMSNRIVFVFTTDSMMQAFQNIYPSYAAKCLLLKFDVQNKKYSGEEQILHRLQGMPGGINPVWDKTVCMKCKSEYCARIPEECNYHHVANRHCGSLVKMHSGSIVRKHTGSWGGHGMWGLVGGGWSCCGKGKGHTTWSHDDCHPRHECDSGCIDVCTSCKRVPNPPGCIEYCPSCNKALIEPPCQTNVNHTAPI